MREEPENSANGWITIGIIVGIVLFFWGLLRWSGGMLVAGLIILCFFICLKFVPRLMKQSTGYKAPNTILPSSGKDTSEFYASGLVEKGEEIAGSFKVNQVNSNTQEIVINNTQDMSGSFKVNKVISNTQDMSGFLVLTNKRLLYVQRPSGFLSKGFDVRCSTTWNDVRSISTSGLLSKSVNVTVQIKDNTRILQFTCDGVGQIAEMMAVCKRNYVEPTTIQATRVIIEEADKDKDNAMVILQKRLAKGEITLEEFHKLVTRL